jgi:holin-like protein
MIQGLLQLLLFQALGELLSHFVFTRIPGPVIGLVLLLVFLHWHGRVPDAIDTVGSGILQHLGLLFIPASVGVVLYWPLLREYGLAVVGALVVSVLATVGVTAALLKWLSPAQEEDADHAP